MIFQGLRGILFVLIAALTAVAQVKAESISVSVDSEETQGVDEALRSTVLELARGTVSNQEGYVLVKSSAALQLKVKLLKLGSSFIVTMSRIQDGAVTYNAKLKAASADDLDTVTPRVVLAALRGKKSEETAEIDNVTEDETTRGTRRFQATRQWKFGFGPVWGSGTNTDKSGYSYLIGYAWGLDPQWETDLSLRFATISKDGESGAFFSDTISIGANYYFTKQKFSPYVVAGLGYGSAAVSKANSVILSDDTASGWTGKIGGGVKFFRTSNVNLGIELLHTRLFSESTRSKSTPSITTLGVALYF